jgi:hypothetical protein
VETAISIGDIVSGLDPTELVEIRKLSPFGNKTLVEAVGLESRREIKRPLTAEQLAQLIKIRTGGYSFDADSETFLLGTEAERIRIAYQFDPLFAVNSSVIDVLPHQVDAAQRWGLQKLSSPNGAVQFQLLSFVAVKGRHRLQRLDGM